MAVTIGSNSLSQRVQRFLNASTQRVGSASERLSSGQRINTAADDAAGLAVSMSLRASSRITTVGIQNLNHGLGLLRITEGALAEMNAITQRVSELSEQAANGIYGAAQRAALQNEALALQDEYNRTLNTAQFNGENVFSLLTKGLSLQGGGNERSLQLTSPWGEVGGLTADGTVQNLRLVSSSSTGVAGNNSSSSGRFSTDSRYVVFYSAASNLVSGDTNGWADMFKKDLLTGTTTIVSSSSSGTIGNGFTDNRFSISSDGRYVAFSSGSSNLVAGDVNGSNDIFVKDTVAGTTTLVSASSSGVQGNGSSTQSNFISSDGRFVGFRSSATDLVGSDTNGAADLFLKDTLTGNITRINTDSSGTQANGSATNLSMSADGRYAVFESGATNLIAGDTNAAIDIFMKDTITGITTRISTDSSGSQANGSSYQSFISSDGRYVAFSSTATNLVANDTNGVADVFLKDILTGRITRVSTDSSGVQGNGDSYEAAISLNNRYVLMTSTATNLAGGDTNGRTDVFLKDTITGQMSLLSKTSTSTQGNQDSSRARMSSDNQYMIFDSNSTNLISGISDYQVYVATLGGIASPEMKNVDLSTSALALTTLDSMKQYQESINSFRGNIGATVYRIETGIRDLQTKAENLIAADHRISSADIAQETSNLLSSEITQKAGIAILAQANQVPSIAVNLLR